MAKAPRKKKSVEPSVPTMEFYVPCEWVVQFDNDEPQIFAQSDINSDSHEVKIILQNTNHSYINFNDNKTGKSFRIFARPKKS
jgi:hypothetical protein